MNLRSTRHVAYVARVLAGDTPLIRPCAPFSALRRKMMGRAAGGHATPASLHPFRRRKRLPVVISTSFRENIRAMG